jgi:hypothetical protein
MSGYRACHFPVLARRKILSPEHSMESRQPPLGANPLRRYSAAQIYLIRQRLRAYKEMKSAQEGPSFSWKSVAEILHLLIEEIEGIRETELRIKDERLRQIAKGQISRGAPSGTTDENLDLIVRFLTHPDIKFLTVEDLNEPDLPYQFAFQLMEFLRHDEHSDLALPPGNLKGRYRAVVRSGGEISDIRVDIIISRDGNLVHVNETADIFADTGVRDPEDWSPGQRRHYFDRHTESRGWGIRTPEDNLLCFLKRRIAKNTYQGNKYYSTLASIPKFGTGVPIEHLAFLTYDGSYGQDDERGDWEQWRQETSQNILSNNLRYFIRIPEDHPSIMGS